MPELSIVIPTFRRREELRRTLEALEAQSVAAGRFEVIAVDDPAKDDSSAVAAVLDAEARPFTVRQLHVSRSRNGSESRNIGWRAAEAPLVLFLGDDILGDPALLAEHLEWHRRHPDPEIGVLGGVRWADELPRTAFMVWLERGIQFDYDRLEGEEAGWGMFYTANVSIKRAMLETVGGFDEERVPFRYEDTDLGFRLEEAGFRLLYNSGAGSQHLHYPTIEEWKARMAETAAAERRFVSLHPELEPYFERLLRDAAAQPARAARLARAALPTPLGSAPVLGPRLWWRADLYFRQQLAPEFLAAWDAQAEVPR